LLGTDSLRLRRCTLAARRVAGASDAHDGARVGVGRALGVQRERPLVRERVAAGIFNVLAL